MNNYIYVDNSSTTKLSSYVLSKMMPYLTNYYGNASTLYELGKASKKAIEISRAKIAKALNVLPEEIFFTGSGTESDNMVICGLARKNKDKGRHIITSKFEHLAVLNTCKELEKEGFIETVVGKGTFVSGTNSERLKEAAMAEMESRLEEVIVTAKSLGLGLDECIEILKDIYEEV